MKTKILVIEDNEQNLYLTTFLLEKSGFEVLQARSGPEGITTAMSDLPQLILLDIQLPMMSGYEVAERIRELDPIKDIPMVAVTSYAMLGDREKVLASGCNGFIEKPINPDTFVQEISQFLPSTNQPIKNIQKQTTHQTTEEGGG
jgi:two-component system, cell cycle response regulator DivK